MLNVLSPYRKGFAFFAMRCLILWLALSAGAWSCQSQTELEAVYCQLKGKGVVLPSLRDFRRNDPGTQKLLLQRPAAREGISLKAIKVGSSSQKATPNNVGRATPKASVAVTSEAGSFVVDSPSSGSSLDQSACQLQGDVIRCQDKRFHFVLNRPNRQLVANSLSADNRLQLPEYNAGLQSVEEYLSVSYRHYIEKMLSIGLGASTMSYSKFYYIWEDTQHQEQSFARRLGKMFEFLKRDKKSLGVKARYDNLMPKALSWCQSLSEELWVCDNKHRNWVYQSRL